jgi:hypothetical protein
MAGHVNHAAISSQGDGNAWPLVETPDGVEEDGSLLSPQNKLVIGVRENAAVHIGAV